MHSKLLSTQAQTQLYPAQAQQAAFAAKDVGVEVRTHLDMRPTRWPAAAARAPPAERATWQARCSSAVPVPHSLPQTAGMRLPTTRLPSSRACARGTGSRAPRLAGQAPTLSHVLAHALQRVNSCRKVRAIPPTANARRVQPSHPAMWVGSSESCYNSTTHSTGLPRSRARDQISWSCDTTLALPEPEQLVFECSATDKTQAAL